jgi:hypothetical protein
MSKHSLIDKTEKRTYFVTAFQYASNPALV